MVIGMNNLLQKKIAELENSSDYECWYLVKQDTNFVSLCYQVEFLREFQENVSGLNLEKFMEQAVTKLRIEKPNVKVSKTHRALRVAAFFGLIIANSNSYSDATISPTFYEIKNRCHGEYELVELYEDIIERQIEKMFISSELDDKREEVRKDFRLYPVMLLYKVLLEIGRAYGEYSITINEYRYFVATTKKFDDFLETLLLIKLLRDDKSVNQILEKYRMKFDNRLIQALKQLPTLEFIEDKIYILPGKVTEVANKVHIFENNPENFVADRYIQFLSSTKSLFELDKDDKSMILEDSSEDRIEVGTNTLLYGVPGVGKSYIIEHEYIKDNPWERLVFHPDYTYADFVGQILPTVKRNIDGSKNVSYGFTPGPFSRIMKDAYENPKTEYFLVIEEINRGNAPAIFGEIFQLLDRKIEYRDKYDDGFPLHTSEYAISNAELAYYIYGDESHKVRIPSNLSIIGTMNTSDQNVFTLDTAFQRRWNMRLIENTFKDSDSKLASTKILDTTITWEKFCTTINEVIIDKNNKMVSSEDKRLGVHFVCVDDLKMTSDEVHNRLFAEKVIKYLWDDAFKFTREEVFDVEEYNSLEKIVREFSSSKGDNRWKIFGNSLREKL